MQTVRVECAERRVESGGKGVKSEDESGESGMERSGVKCGVEWNGVDCWERS